MNTQQVGRGLLGASAVLNIVSMLLPWDDPNNHYYKFSFNYAFFVDCVEADALLDGIRLLAEGIGCISPSILGVILLIAALLPRGRVNTLVSSVLQVALLLILAVVAGILFAYDFGQEGADRRMLIAAGGGMAFFVLLAFVEIWIVVKSLRRVGASGDAVHVLPLTLFFVVGTALAVALHGSDVWHSVDYVVIGAASALGLFGVWLRRDTGSTDVSTGSAGVPPKSSQGSGEIPFAP